jgi:hypothetical protein
MSDISHVETKARFIGAGDINTLYKRFFYNTHYFYIVDSDMWLDNIHNQLLFSTAKVILFFGACRTVHRTFVQ